MKKVLNITLGLFFAAVAITSCKKDDKATSLKNEFIKRTQSPMIVGEKIEFAYGAGSTNGKLSTMQVVASIPGAPGTIFEMVTHRTTTAGTDATTVVATGAVTNGATTTVNITDTAATTLRYTYVIPEAARGQQVTFAFSVKNRAGDEASTSTPAYSITNLDMARNITVTGTAAGARYFSIADMKAYTQAEVDAGNLSAKIDFVYAYAATITPTTTAYAYGHSLVSPAATGYFPAGFTIPAAWVKNSTAMERKIGTALFDGQLKNDANISTYVDERDIREQSFAGSANYAITLTADYSIFMKTADGKYNAYIYVNSVNNTTPSAIIGIKRIRNF